MFLVLDGPDGCGKSTQARLLVEALRAEGRTVQHLREPGGTPLGEALRELLLTRREQGFEIAPRAEVLLFFASRCQLLEERVRPALARGETVVCERYVSSTFAYQSRASGAGEELVLGIARAVLAEAFPPPLTLILDLPAEEGLRRSHARAGADRIEARGLAYHAAVRQGFLRYAELFPSVTRVLPVAGRSVEEVAALVRAALREAEAR
ncbi:MAG: dTMP kinase [Planctomycetes bacterium]|nr:dTMP kinase [Planctomycetota bacterium]